MDIWQDLNAECRRFTWHRPTPLQQSHLNFLSFQYPWFHMLSKRTSTEETVNKIQTLSDEEVNNTEGKITLEEATRALKNMKKKKEEKSSGIDSFTSEFFKVFWKQPEYFVVRSLNDGFNKSKLLATQKGLTVCIPKGDKPKNWRSISERYVVYKIGASCIANRLKKVLLHL